MNPANVAKAEIRHIAVLVPARNEEALLPRCLRSICVARQRLPLEVTCDVIVVSDRSHDRTAELAEQMLGRTGKVLRSHAGVVGRVRAQAADAALERWTGVPDTCWLANTDADCEVPPDWLALQMSQAARGTDALAGIVDVDSFEEHGSHVERRFRLTYQIYGDGTHPHVHGANLGVRAAAYLAVGGWSPLATAEDHDLWGRLKGRGYRTVADAALQVKTSGRRQGRAPAGFAQALAAHNEAVSG